MSTTSHAPPIRFTSSIAVILLAALVANGCGSTQQSNFWVDSTYQAAPLKKVMVVAIRKDQVRRRLWEDALVKEIGGTSPSGTVALASYQIYPNDLPDTLALREQTVQSGFDGVLLVAKALVDTTVTNIPGYTTTEQVATYSQRWNAYIMRFQDVYHPGYSENETTVSVRVDLLVPKEDGRLVWSVTSQAVDPTEIDDFRSSVAGKVASQLRKGRLIY